MKLCRAKYYYLENHTEFSVRRGRARYTMKYYSVGRNNSIVVDSLG